MAAAFALIGDAWSLVRKQPVLRPVALWLLVLPGIVFNVASRIMDAAFAGEPTPYDAWIGNSDRALLPAGIAAVAAIAGLLWGTACVLVVGRRFLKSAAGRSRTSFRAVRREGLHHALPLLLTSILRACIGTLWTFLFVVPGVIYFTRTAFFSPVVVCEKTPYRPALRRSRDVVRGRTGRVLWTLVCLGVMVGVPVSAASVLLEMSLPLGLHAIVDVVDALLQAAFVVTFELAATAYYARLKRTAVKTV